MKYSFLFVAIELITLVSCNKENPDYREKWVGIYVGQDKRVITIDGGVEDDEIYNRAYDYDTNEPWKTYVVRMWGDRDSVEIEYYPLIYYPIYAKIETNGSFHGTEQTTGWGGYSPSRGYIHGDSILLKRYLRGTDSTNSIYYIFRGKKL